MALNLKPIVHRILEDDLSAVFCGTERIIEFRNAAGRLLRTLSLPDAPQFSSAVA
jgi:hypothetical protein